MTVGIGLIFRWCYGENDWGWAALGASDRMLTDNDTVYEPPQMKFGALGRRVTLVTAGAIHIHSEALRAAQKELRSTPTESVEVISEIYAAQIRAVRRRLAAQTYLSPYGLDEISFLDKQRDMSPELVVELAHKIERFSPQVEAIILGIDDDGSAHIYHIDGDGIATCHSDIGFITIGIGGPHAKLQLMAARYSQHASQYLQALAMIYFAKKCAEVAAGVGCSTDIVLITRGGSELILEKTVNELEAIYQDVVAKRSRATAEAIERLDHYFKLVSTTNEADAPKLDEQPQKAPDATAA